MSIYLLFFFFKEKTYVKFSQLNFLILSCLISGRIFLPRLIDTDFLGGKNLFPQVMQFTMCIKPLSCVRPRRRQVDSRGGSRLIAQSSCKSKHCEISTSARQQRPVRSVSSSNSLESWRRGPEPDPLLSRKRLAPSTYKCI